MYKLLFVLILFIPMVSAEETAKLLVEAKVYKTNKLNGATTGLKDLLADATLEHNPRLLSEYGKQTDLRLDFQNDNGSESAAMEIMVIPDASTKTFNVDINLIDGGKKNISRITDHPIGKTFIASTVIDDASRVVQIDVSDATPARATLILQVSSNLGCDALTIELNSNGQQHHLDYSSNAFASVALPEGEFNFGNVTCRKGDDQQILDVLQDKIMPLHVDLGRTYYGGRLIFKQDIANQTDEDIENCRPVYSRARGVKQDNLCDGGGLETLAQASTQIAVYKPAITDEQVKTISRVYAGEGEPLQYLPMIIKN